MSVTIDTRELKIEDFRAWLVKEAEKDRVFKSNYEDADINDVWSCNCPVASWMRDDLGITDAVVDFTPTSHLRYPTWLIKFAFKVDKYNSGKCLARTALEILDSIADVAKVADAVDLKSAS